MERLEAQKLVAETGRMLLEKGLVARTWGNVSARIDEERFAITPSGLDYTQMTAADVVVMNLKTKEWEGQLKPSGERGVHAAAYQFNPAIGFVIHTHQTYATAIGLSGFDDMVLTPEEMEQLEGIALAGYGLPGTKKLTENVDCALKTGAHVVLMAHHGALICGRDREDAFHKALVLEEAAKRSVEITQDKKKTCNQKAAGEILAAVKKEYPHYQYIMTPEIMEAAALKQSIPSQLDDMAQMIGTKIPWTDAQPDKVLEVLKKTDAVLIPTVGAIMKAEDSEDCTALGILVEKSVICFLHTKQKGVRADLSWFDTRLMRFVYKQKYSKQKTKK